MSHILLVEDELSIAESLVYVLESECFTVKHATTGGEAIEYLRDNSDIQLAILDVGLPDMTGFDLCREIQKNTSLAVMFLTARDSEIDRVLGLELGGDDYVTKPFSPREVSARVRAILRRCNLASAESKGESRKFSRSDVLEHNEERKMFFYKGDEIILTTHEYHLLLALYNQPGRVFSREQLLDKAWEDPHSVLDRTVDAHIKSLRSKLKEMCPDREWIETRRGLGYAFIKDA